jgi:uncharacterized protein
LGLFVGLAFGYVSQRGRFCMLSACYEVITGREPDMMRALLLAVVVQMIALSLSAELGYLALNVPPFFGVVTLLAGFIFGMGMTLSMGCAGSVFFRAGEGKTDYLYVIAAFFLSAWLSKVYLVKPVHGFFTDRGMSITIDNALTLDRLVLVAVLAVIISVWVIKGKSKPYQGGWKWPVTGLFLGLIGIMAWAVHLLSGRTYGLGAVQGSENLAVFLLEQDIRAINGSLLMVLGIPIGSLIASRRCGKSPDVARPGLKRIFQSVAGGIMMGASAAVALGDNVFHGLSGAPLLAVSSLGFMLFVFFGVWSGIKLKWIK